MFRILIVLFASALISQLASAQDPQLELLFLGDQRGHQPATRFKILEPALAQKGITLKYTEDVGDLNSRTLGQYDGLVLYANIDTIGPKQANALLDYVDSGKGFIPIHCASYCFRNSPEVVALIGAQFKKHGAGEMTTRSAGIAHPVVEGYETFTSWDETYVHHKHNARNRVVLEYRHGDLQETGNQREPWTWVRTHGKGRVFYTAWGHDERTWNQPRFHRLVERGIRWACGEGPTMVPVEQEKPVLARMKQLSTNLKPFDYVDVGPEIPNYTAGHGKTLNLMQQPVPAVESMKHIVTPVGFHVELFADESMLGGEMFEGKPIAMNWDPQGRLWVCETLDYPNELKQNLQGRDRIRVISDTDGDGQADQSRVFAENLSIPTAIAFHRGGLVVQNGTETLYLKDTDGDGRADVRDVLISNWKMIDTHGGVSNFRNGLDNWIYAMQGYNDSSPVIGGEVQPGFRMGFFRFKLSQDDSPKVERLEFLRSTTNNTWGLGISEEGLIFGSTANRQPSFFMPIANRYYERVKGWAPDRLSMICDTHLFDPITDKVRQVDHHGGYTAAAGHAVYTARNYPKSWWNRTAFVCGPTGKLVGTFLIERRGAGMKSESPINLFASDDEWTAPIMAEIGPDGNVWVLDWYNYIVQHNPTPQGFETGKGQAYETKLRDKKYGRIYRVVPDKPLAPAGAPPAETNSLSELIDALSHPTMLVRLHAQRLLVERADDDVVPRLLKVLRDQSVDEIGMNVAAIHALQTLNGLGQLSTESGGVFTEVIRSLSHPSAGVRLNAVRVLPACPATVRAIRDSKLLVDPDAQVVLAALLKISDTEDFEAGQVLADAINDPKINSDRWLMDAITSAGAVHVESFLPELLLSNQKLSDSSLLAIRRVAEHFARELPSQSSIVSLLGSMSATSTNANDAVIAGLSNGWSAEHSVKLPDSENGTLKAVFEGVSAPAKASLAKLAASWSNRALEKDIEPIIDGFFRRVNNSDLELDQRLTAANQLMELDPNRVASVRSLEELIGPQSPPELSNGLILAISQSKVDGLGTRFLNLLDKGTPEVRSSIIRTMLSREKLTRVLLAGVEAGRLQVTDLSTEQRASLSSHPSNRVRQLSARLFREGGIVIDENRSKLIADKVSLMEETGDPKIGKTVFAKHCSNCHVYKGEGQIVGPNLTGMSVHPKTELLTHILDPNRSVEANYRLYTVVTVDGRLTSGLLSAESLTTIEIVDSQGKRHTILREDIDELKPSKKSAMPEGFEQSIDDRGLVDLLEYLTEKGKYVPLGIEDVANTITTRGMFTDHKNRRERLALSQWGSTEFNGVPFYLIDPREDSVNNAIMLHGPLGAFAPKMPKSVSVQCRTSARLIHVLGGVGGWSSQQPRQGRVAMIVRLKYSDGESEDHPLVDGQHLADYIGRFDVPKSEHAFDVLDGGQLRYLSIKPNRKTEIDSIVLVKANHDSAPIVMAISVELP